MQARGAAGRSTEDRILRLSAALLGASLFLQRFGVPFAGKQISLVGPIGYVLFGYGLASGLLVFERRRLLLFLALATLAFVGAAWHATGGGQFGGGQVSYTSMGQFLLLTSFSTLTFSQPVSEASFFRMFTGLLALIGVAGAIQFVAQFFGLRLFAFTGLLPGSMLFEAIYNLQIPVGFGDLLKSNGFFLLEPSIFSQMMALGLMIEAVGTRRPAYLLIFVAGLFLSFSGTGWIVLAAFLMGSTVGMGSRGAVIALCVATALMVSVGLVALFAPDGLQAMAARLNEINTPGTSGHGRFITPFWFMSDVYGESPGAVLLGIGGGASETLTLPYAYSVNTPTKVAVEYGVPALVAYVLAFAVGRRTSAQASLVLPALVLFFVTGGYQQLPPVIIVVLLLVTISRLSERDGVAQQAATARKNRRSEFDVVRPAT